MHVRMQAHRHTQRGVQFRALLIVRATTPGALDDPRRSVAEHGDPRAQISYRTAEPRPECKRCARQLAGMRAMLATARRNASDALSCAPERKRCSQLHAGTQAMLSTARRNASDALNCVPECKRCPQLCAEMQAMLATVRRNASNALNCAPERKLCPATARLSTMDVTPAVPSAGAPKARLFELQADPRAA